MAERYNRERGLVIWPRGLVEGRTWWCSGTRTSGCSPAALHSNCWHGKLARAFRIHAITGDEVLAVWEDELDVEYVGVWELEWPE